MNVATPEAPPRYRVLRTLGRGGMGVVVEAHDAERGIRVALKRAVQTGPTALLDLKREFRAAAEVLHPNVVRMYDLVADEGGAWFSMELVVGTDLGTWLGWPGASDLGRLERAVPQLLDGLEALHRRGVVHRDLKPSNVLVDVHGVVRIIDLGIAIDRSAPGAPQVAGTRAWQAPEQAVGRPVGPAADLFAVGRILSKALAAGGPPAWIAVARALQAEDPRDRPTLADVRAQLGLGGRAPEPRPPFVGRQTELGAIADALAAPGGGIVLVTGTAGIGKSTLVAEVVERHRARGELVLAGRCRPQEVVPFRAFDAVVDALAATVRRWPVGFRRAADPDLADAAALFPALATARVTPSDEDVPSDLRTRRMRAFEGLAALLARVLELGPGLVVIDDLHWADRDSLDLLEDLVTRPRPALRVLASSRTVLRPGPWRVWEVPVGPMPADDLAGVVRAVAGVAPDRVEALVARARGVPLLAVELSHGAGTDAATLAELVDARRGALTPRAREVVDLVALADAAVPLDALREASVLDRDAFGQALDAAFRLRLLRGSPVRQLEFPHDALREAAVDRIPAHEQRSLNARIARALDHALPERVDARLFHWRQAGDDARVDALLPLAAEAAARELAFDRAIALTRERLERLERPGSGQETARVRLRLGELLELQGSSGEAALVLARVVTDDPDVALAARLRRGTALVKVGRVREGIALLDPIAAAEGVVLDRPRASRAAVLAGLAAASAVRARIPGMRRAPTPAARLRLERLRQLVEAFALGDPLVVAECALRCQLAAQRLDDPSARTFELVLGAAARLAWNPTPARLRSARTALDEAEAARATGASPDTRFYVRYVRAWVHLLEGDLLGAHGALEATMADYERAGVGHRWEAVTCRALLLSTALELGEHARVEALVDLGEARPGADAVHFAIGWFYRVVLRVRQGRVDDAEVLLRRWAERLPEPATRLAFLRECATLLVDLARGDHGRVVARWRDRTPALTREGWLSEPLGSSAWWLPSLESGAALAAGGQLQEPDRHALLRIARRFSRHGLPTHGALGARAVAHLDTGVRSDRALDDALVRSARHPVPWVRWLCLHTAVRRGREGREEIARLAERYGYALVPPG